MKQEELARLATENANLVVMIREMRPTNDEERAALAEALVDIKTEIKAVDAKKKRATQPMNEALKEVRGWFKPLEGIYKAAEDEGKRLLLTYDRERRERQQAELAHAVETQDRTALIRATIPEQKIDKTSKRKVWRVKVHDKTQVPQAYLLVDERALLALARSGKDAPAGVEFFQEETLAIGGR